MYKSQSKNSDRRLPVLSSSCPALSCTDAVTDWTPSSHAQAPSSPQTATSGPPHRLRGEFLVVLLPSLGGRTRTEAIWVPESGFGAFGTGISEVMCPHSLWLEVRVLAEHGLSLGSQDSLPLGRGVAKEGQSRVPGTCGLRTKRRMGS